MSGVSGRWSFVQADGRTRIDLDMHIEPGGGVPNWLARQRIVGTPTKMLDEPEDSASKSVCPIT